jgi:predicted amidohydrolase YtcJ
LRAGNSVDRSTPVDLSDPIGVTRDPTWQGHRERDIGSPEVGKVADFVVLDRDRLAIPREELAVLNVLETGVGGRPVWTSL